MRKHVHAMFSSVSQCLRRVNAEFTQRLRRVTVYAVFTQSLCIVFAEFMQCLRSLCAVCKLVCTLFMQYLRLWTNINASLRSAYAKSGAGSTGCGQLSLSGRCRGAGGWRSDASVLQDRWQDVSLKHLWQMLNRLFVSFLTFVHVYA